MDKSREQFESWYLRRWGHTEDNHDTLFEIEPDDDCYYRLGVRMAYDAWQASRAAVEIVLPNGVTTREALDAGYTCDYAAGMDDGIEACEDAILAAGLKVKGE